MIPKTAENKGYYTGIEQTLSLLTYGLDYATLWHVFLVPLEEREDMDQIISENVEWIACYAQFIDQAFIKIIQRLLMGKNKPGNLQLQNSRLLQSDVVTSRNNRRTDSKFERRDTKINILIGSQLYHYSS